MLIYRRFEQLKPFCDNVSGTGLNLLLRNGYHIFNEGCNIAIKILSGKRSLSWGTGIKVLQQGLKPSDRLSCGKKEEILKLGRVDVDAMTSQYSTMYCLCFVLATKANANKMCM